MKSKTFVNTNIKRIIENANLFRIKFKNLTFATLHNASKPQHELNTDVPLSATKLVKLITK